MCVCVFFYYYDFLLSFPTVCFFCFNAPNFSIRSSFPRPMWNETPGARQPDLLVLYFSYFSSLSLHTKRQQTFTASSTTLFFCLLSHSAATALSSTFFRVLFFPLLCSLVWLTHLETSSSFICVVWRAFCKKKMQRKKNQTSFTFSSWH